MNAERAVKLATVWEEGSGRALVLLHGVFMDRTLWDAVSPRLAPHPRLRVDMPGHGASATAPDGATLDAHVDAVAATVRAAGLERPVLVGHSWGGMVGLRLAARVPSALGGLVLVNTPLRGTRGAARFGFAAQRTLLSLGLPPALYGRMAAGSLFGADFRARSPEQVRALAERTDRLGRHGLRETVRAVLLEPDDAVELLDELALPWIAVAGDDDYVLGGGVREHLTERDALIVGRGAHGSPLEDPDAVLSAIEHVLARCEKADERPLEPDSNALRSSTPA